jgi:AcrR family transcriptional regulator
LTGPEPVANVNTRDGIIAAAASLVLQRGVARTALDDVGRLAGLTPEQLARNFPDEMALFRGVLNRGPGVVPEAQKVERNLT